MFYKNEIKFQILRSRGIEPRSVPWEGTMIPLHQLRDHSLHVSQLLYSEIKSFFSLCMILLLLKVMKKDKSIHARRTSPSVSFVVAKLRPSAEKYVLKENIDINSLF